MADSEQEEQSLGDRLYSRGWRQGAIFTAPSAAFAHNAPTASTPTSPTTPIPLGIQHRPVKTKEHLVLVTQDCDITAVTNEEPYVEALICDTKGASFASKIDRNSARYFLIDPATRLVAQARYRVVLAKAALILLTPMSWPSSQDRFERFVRWLARRYDRPAIPDAMVEVFQHPIEEALVALDRASPAVGAAFSRAIHEVRVNLPEHEQPPFGLQLVFLIKHEVLTEEETDSLFTAFDAIQAALDPARVTLDPDLRIVNTEEISMAEYFATRPLFLEYLTYKGEEVVGTRPLPRG